MQNWDRRPDEPPDDYELFIDFCLMGPQRSLRGLWRAWQIAHPDEQRRHVPEAWSRTRDRYDWIARAAAWDADRHNRPLTPDQHLRLAAQRRRLAIAQHGVEQALRVIDSALQDELGVREARALLPMARQLLRDMLLIEREEEQAAPDSAPPPIGADEIARAEAAWLAEQAQTGRAEQAQTGRAEQAQTGRAEQAALHSQEPAAPAPPARLLLCTGSDPALEIDTAHLRQVREQTGLRFHHLRNPARDDFATTLARERSLGRPIRYVHLACHSSQAGVEFRDGIADGAWLSAALSGVEVLLIAGCNGDRVGDWLGVVPRVVTLADAVGHSDAGMLAYHFWRGIGLGLDADAALDHALQRCAQVLEEFVVRHW